MAEQHPVELAWLLREVAGSSSILEIGSRGGSCLWQMAQFCQPRARICSVDLGRDCEDPSRHHQPVLESTIAMLRQAGYQAEVLFADSTTPEAIAWAKARAPFDFVFIDGDHSYAGVSADWKNYREFGKRVGFHDIRNPLLGVRQLWEHLRGSGLDMVERSAAASPMGIGIIYQG